jgi:hypothetical protein
VKKLIHKLRRAKKTNPERFRLKKPVWNKVESRRPKEKSRIRWAGAPGKDGYEVFPVIENRAPPPRHYWECAEGELMNY